MKISDYIYKGNITVQQKKNSLAIRIPMKRSLKNLILLIFSTIIWAISLFIFINIFIQYSAGFWIKLAFFALFLLWFGIGLVGASIFMWIFFGRERIIVNQDFLITEKPLVFFYRRSFYNIFEISNIRIDKEIYKVNRNNVWQENFRTVLKFDTPNKTSIFARNIDNKDAEYVLFLLAKCSFLKEEQFAVVQ
jgi:hypothetical protein